MSTPPSTPTKPARGDLVKIVNPNSPNHGKQGYFKPNGSSCYIFDNANLTGECVTTSPKSVQKVEDDITCLSSGDLVKIINPGSPNHGKQGYFKPNGSSCYIFDNANLTGEYVTTSPNSIQKVSTKEEEEIKQEEEEEEIKQEEEEKQFLTGTNENLPKNSALLARDIEDLLVLLKAKLLLKSFQRYKQALEKPCDDGEMKKHKANVKVGDKDEDSLSSPLNKEKTGPCGSVTRPYAAADRSQVLKIVVKILHYIKGISDETIKKRFIVLKSVLDEVSPFLLMESCESIKEIHKTLSDQSTISDARYSIDSMVFNRILMAIVFYEISNSPEKCYVDLSITELALEDTDKVVEKLAKNFSLLQYKINDSTCLLA